MVRHDRQGNKRTTGSVLERRRHVRYAGDGLLVMIAGRFRPAADISLGGIRIRFDTPLAYGTKLDLRIIPVIEELMLLGDGAHVEAQVVGFDDYGLRLAFLRQRSSVSRLVAGHSRRYIQRCPFAAPVTALGC